MISMFRRLKAAIVRSHRKAKEATEREMRKAFGGDSLIAELTNEREADSLAIFDPREETARLQTECDNLQNLCNAVADNRNRIQHALDQCEVDRQAIADERDQARADVEAALALASEASADRDKAIAALAIAKEFYVGAIQDRDKARDQRDALAGELDAVHDQLNKTKAVARGIVPGWHDSPLRNKATTTDSGV